MQKMFKKWQKMPKIDFLSDNNSLIDANRQVFFCPTIIRFLFLSDNNSCKFTQIIGHFKALLEDFCVCHALLVYQIIKFFYVRTLNSYANFLSLYTNLCRSSPLFQTLQNIIHLAIKKKKRPCFRPQSFCQLIYLAFLLSSQIFLRQYMQPTRS